MKKRVDNDDVLTSISKNVLENVCSIGKLSLASKILSMESKMLLNPARDFANKMKSGYYNSWSEEDIYAESKKFEFYSEFWNNEHEISEINLFVNILCKLDLMKMLEYLYKNSDSYVSVESEDPKWDLVERDI